MNNGGLFKDVEKKYDTLKERGAAGGGEEASHRQCGKFVGGDHSKKKKSTREQGLY